MTVGGVLDRKGHFHPGKIPHPDDDVLALSLEVLSPLFVDFGSLVVKRRTQAGKKQGLLRACQPAPQVRIIDATAGWGRDAALLASFGAEVLMLERHPTMAALLADGLRRKPSSLTLSLEPIDALPYLTALQPADYPDVIYIDPMHPTRQKSALVKKDMQVLQQLIGADNDALSLIARACERVKRRVVVKWPQRLPPLLKPSRCVAGKTVRFDVYD